MKMEERDKAPDERVGTGTSGIPGSVKTLDAFYVK